MSQKIHTEHNTIHTVKVGDTFEVGWKVKQSGTYVCVPCGYRLKFKEGDIFPPCFDCLEDKKYNDDAYIKDLGVWEFKRK